MNTVLESLNSRQTKQNLVVIKQDIQQMSNRIITLEVSKQPSNTAGIDTMISEALNEEKERQNLTSRKGVSRNRSHMYQKTDKKMMKLISGADVVPESVRRFGKVNPDKPRLLMVKCQQWKIKDRHSNLHGN